jgi:hypothetical protein
VALATKYVLSQGGDTRQLLGPLLPALLDGLLHMAANFSASAEILALILENLAVVSGFTVYSTPERVTVYAGPNYSPGKALRHLDSRIMIFFLVYIETSQIITFRQPDFPSDFQIFLLIGL